jgi:kynureninase
MSVERTERGHQIRYELHHGAALVGVLIFGQPEIEPAAWKILLPGPGGTEDLYATERFQAPNAPQLRAWLTPFVGTGPAAELTDAVEAQPPLTSGWARRPSG